LVRILFFVSSVSIKYNSKPLFTFICIDHTVFFISELGKKYWKIQMVSKLIPAKIHKVYTNIGIKM